MIQLLGSVLTKHFHCVHLKEILTLVVDRGVRRPPSDHSYTLAVSNFIAGPEKGGLLLTRPLRDNRLLGTLKYLRISVN